jgi:hypothetical protein
MNHSSKPRFAIDLDEVERQLQSTGPEVQPALQAVEPARSAPAPVAHRNDPLAELARIVGQDDPFGNLLAADRPAPPARKAPTFDELFAPRGEPIRPVATADRWPEPTPRQAYSDAPVHAEGRGYDDPSGRVYAEEPGYDEAQPAYHGHYEEHVDQDAGHDSYPPQGAGDSYEAAYETKEVPAPRKSRKATMAVASVLGVAALSVGGVVLFGGKGTAITGEPPLVMATAGSTKVQPQTPGGVEIPNQNKQIYERAAHETQTKVVNREEQPVDVRQASRVAAGTPDATTTGSAASAASNNALGEPRRVRTIAIRPDGTVVPDPGPTAAAPAPAPTRTAAATSMTLPAAAAQATPAPATPAAATPAPARHATAALSTPAPRPAAATPVTSTTPAPMPVAEQAARPQRVASVQPTAPAAAAESSAGGFAVQIGTAGSEADGRKTFQKLQQKFSALNSQSAVILKAEVKGNTVYRIRTGAMSKDEASSLCATLQGSGCFVVKN